MSPADPDTAGRVTTVEVFFDVVFVFTVTQLALVLEDDLTWAGLGRVVLVLGVLWYPYTGYAWLTNQVPPRRPAQKITLFAGMAGFLLTSIAIPAAFTDTGLLFALGYLVLTGVHLIMFGRSAARAAAIRLTPYNLAAALLILLAAFVTGPATYALWVAAALVQAALPYLTPRHSWIRVAGTYEVAAGHLVERHGLLVIVALGESVVAIGAGVDIHHLTPGTAGAIVMALALPAALWWTYFTDTRAATATLDAAEPRVRTHLAARTFVLPHYLLLLGIVATATGIHAVVAHPDAPAGTAAALALAGGVALYLTGVGAARLALGLGLPLSRAAGAVAVLAAVPLGVWTVAGAQLAAVIVVLIAMLLAGPRHPAARTA
ncbi:Low temperature requirement protein LtrA [Micromonospora rhizosphaerae]|uniref:Low temperature requirement protein LtrA n=1 Tax=Micromonospora rhizosphaerae TaxID=568872 RepID=A0A1C6SPK4_9ACTN|nr:low temperature requirement protein A [Micromonospora rhizosphaerae]SCL31418.1 Low temperature requirement protein LtrA [Micromonospora rhizosphaerae]